MVVCAPSRDGLVVTADYANKPVAVCSSSGESSASQMAALAALFVYIAAVPINDDIESSVAMLQLLHAAKPSFVCTTSNLGVGIDTRQIDVITVVPTRTGGAMNAKDQCQWMGRGLRFSLVASSSDADKYSRAFADFS